MNDPPKIQIRFRFLALAIIYVPALIIIALIALISEYAGVSIRLFLADPTVTLRGHPLTGMQSNLGVLVWCAAAAICFFSSALLQRKTDIDKTLPSFLLWSGIITSALLLDDLFVFHDDLVNRYLRLSGDIVFVGYGLAIASYVVRFRRIILGSEYHLLLLAFVFFGSSVVIDIFQNKWESPWRIFFEDGFKFLGIVSWSGYLIRTCFHRIWATLTGCPNANQTHN